MHSEETRITFVKLFYKNESYFLRARSTFIATFGMDLEADCKTLRTWIRTSEGTGSLFNIKPPGPNRSIRNEINIDRMSLSLHEDDTLSTRKRSTQLNISCSSLRRILKKYHKLFPYKLQLPNN